MKKVFSLFDDDGELVKQSMYTGSPLNEGWIVMYKEGLQRLLKETNELSKVKVFIYLSTKQTYDSLVVTSIRNIATECNLAYKTTWACIKWLEEHKFLTRVNRDGIVGFLLNPDVTTCGKKSLPVKQKMWSMKFDNIDTETGEIF